MNTINIQQKVRRTQWEAYISGVISRGPRPRFQFINPEAVSNMTQKSNEDLGDILDVLKSPSGEK